MNDSASLNQDRSSQHHTPTIHRACLSLGSNIQPEVHIPKAVALLKRYAEVESVSGCWETRAVGSSGTTASSAPNFINLAVCLLTPLSPTEFKEGVIAAIEAALGRMRTADKYAPRTIDLDIILYDDQVFDDHLWQRLYLALPVSELFPDLPHPQSGQPLRQVAELLNRDEEAVLRPGIL